MAVTPQSLLEAAQTLGRGEAEVDWRNAASRVYYAVTSSMAAWMQRDPGWRQHGQQSNLRRPLAASAGIAQTVEQLIRNQ